MLQDQTYISISKGVDTKRDKTNKKRSFSIVFKFIKLMKFFESISKLNATLQTSRDKTQ